MGVIRRGVRTTRPAHTDRLLNLEGYVCLYATDPCESNASFRYLQRRL